MAKRGSHETLILVDGHDVGRDTIELEFAVESGEIEEVHGFGDSWVHNGQPGVKRATLTQRAFYDDADNSTVDAFVSSHGETRILNALLAGNAQSRKFTGFSAAVQTNVSRAPARGEFTKVEVEFAVSDAVEEGRLIQSLAAQDDAGVTTDGALDQGASSSDGGALYLQVTNLDLGGYDDVDVVVEDSDNGSDWDTLATFNVDEFPHAARTVVAGTIEQHVRVSLTWNGTGSDETITILVGLVRY